MSHGRGVRRATFSLADRSLRWSVTVLLPASKDDSVLAYHHTRPFWRTHIVVVPKRHIASFTDVAPDDRADLLHLLKIVQQVARTVEHEHGAAAVLTNLGGYQDSKHLHVHVHSGRAESVTPSTEES